ncbi:MAG: ABC transporter permease [Bifidobacteriaceae bacterium]|jgi:ABC-2 type transport system permease protein|nr:ABC transporter permease [Bifidobacteriaceae bacterium]
MNRVALVTKREVIAQARTKGFIIGTLVMIAIAFLGTAIPGLISGGLFGSGEATKVVAVGDLAASLGGLDGLEVSQVADAAAAEQAVRDETADAAVVAAPSEPLGLKVIALDNMPGALVSALTVAPTVELLDPPKVQWLVGYLATMFFAVAFFMIVIMYGQTAAMNTVVEKQTRVIEILLATVPARVLLAGKILSNAVLAFVTVAGIVVALIAGLLVGGGWRQLAEGAEGLAAAAGASGVWGMLGTALVWFLVFFVVAFVLFSALMVGSAATVSRPEEVSSVLSPTMILAMVPYFLVIFFNDNRTVVDWLSYIPFSSPVAMPLRLITDRVAWWEPVVALILLAVTAVAAIWLGGKLYENSILRTGARVKFKDAFKASAA